MKKEFMKVFDKNGDGAIEFDEFMEIYEKNHPGYDNYYTEHGAKF